MLVENLTTELSATAGAMEIWKEECPQNEAFFISHRRVWRLLFVHPFARRKILAHRASNSSLESRRPLVMATWKYGPVKCSEDWGIEYRDAEYSMEYATVSDYLSVFRIFEGKTEQIMSLGHDPAIEVAKMMSKWLAGYHGNPDPETLQKEIENLKHKLLIESAEVARLHALIKRRGI